MLTKSGLKHFLCPACNSGEIFEGNKGGLFKIGNSAIVRLYKNQLLCCHCGEICSWSFRTNLSVKNVEKNPSLLDIKLPKYTREYFMTAAQVEDYEMPCLDIKDGDLTPDGIEWSPDYKDDYSHWTHGVDWFGIWAPYNGWRFKDHYSVQLWDGTVLHDMYPNGSAWSGAGECIPDVAVRFIRLSHKTWLDDEDGSSKAFRKSRNIEYFGEDEAKWEAFDKNRWVEKLKGQVSDT